MTEIDAWYTLQNLFEVTDILEHKKYDLRNWRDVRGIVSKLNKVTGNAVRLQKENEQLVNAINNWKDSYDELYSDNKILERENGYLKQQLNEMIDIFNNSGLDYLISSEVEEILDD